MVFVVGRVKCDGCLLHFLLVVLFCFLIQSTVVENLVCCVTLSSNSVHSTVCKIDDHDRIIMSNVIYIPLCPPSSLVQYSLGGSTKHNNSPTALLFFWNLPAQQCVPLMPSNPIPIMAISLRWT